MSLDTITTPEYEASAQAYAQRTCRREILLPRDRAEVGAAVYAELETMVLKPLFRTDLPGGRRTDIWWVYEGREWQVAGRDGWVYTAPLAGFQFRQAWMPGDVMAYYPFGS